MEKKKQKTILVIEDDVNVLSVIVKHLEHAGYHVMTATDGLEGSRIRGFKDSRVAFK